MSALLSILLTVLTTVNFTPTQTVPARYYDASGWEGFVSSTWTIQLVRDADNALQIEFNTTNGANYLAGDYTINSSAESGGKMDGVQFDCLGGNISIEYMSGTAQSPVYRFRGAFIAGNYNTYTFDASLPVQAFDYSTGASITLQDGSSATPFNPLDTLTNPRFQADALTAARFVFDHPGDTLIIDNQIAGYGIVELTLARQEQGFNEGVVFDAIFTLPALDNGRIPAGDYPIDYSDANGHAYASTGYDLLGGPEPTYILTRQNGFDQALWCFVSGNIHIGYDQNGKIQVLATGKNWFGFDLIVAYNSAAPELPDAIEQVQGDQQTSQNIPVKLIRNSELLIMHNAKCYTVHGLLR